MSYATPLETRLAKKVTRAIVEYDLIQDGDRVMVGLSGGKDSWALFQILDVLRRRAPISFSLIAVNVNSGYERFRHDLVSETCAARGWECRVEHTTIGRDIPCVQDAVPKVLMGFVKFTVVFGVAQLYHLKGFWKSYRNSNTNRSLSLNCLDAEKFAAMKRCASMVRAPTLPWV